MAAGSDNPKLHEIDGVRIFAAGRARGDDWTESEIDAIVRNGNANFEVLKPTVVVGHEESQRLTDGLPATHKQNSGEPAFGVVTNLRKEFDTVQGAKVPFLVARFGDVPGWLAGLIRGKAYRTVSAEIYPKPPEGVTNAEGPMLRRVALLGGEMPQIKTLGDLPLPEYQQYAESKYGSTTTVTTPAKITFRDAVKRADGTVILFSEVTPMAAYKFIKGKVKKFADLTSASKATLKKFDDMPAEGAAPSAGRQEMLSLLADAGVDVSTITDAVPDNVLAEMVRVLQAQQQAAAASQNSEPAPAPIPAPAPTPPATGIPAAQPSSVTLKYGERTVGIDEYIALKLDEGKRAFEASNAAALKTIADFKTTTKRDGIAAFCELQVKAGRMLPVERDTQIELALSLDDSVKKFGEGQSQTALDFWRAGIEARPLLVKMAERMKQPLGANATDDEVAKVRCYAEQEAETLKKAGITTDGYVATFTEARKKDPTLTAERYGVPA